MGPPFIVGLDLRPVGRRAAGIILIDVVVPGTMRDAVVERNYVHDNSRYRPGEGIPSASGNGILLGGVANARVSHNRVVRNVPSPDPATGAPAELALGGIALFDSTFAGGSAPTNNLVTHNTPRHNQPYDLRARRHRPGPLPTRLRREYAPKPLARVR